MLRTRSPQIADAPEIQLQIAKDVLKTESEALAKVGGLLDEEFGLALERIEECSGCVLVTGMGKAGLVGQKIAATLASTGTRAHFLHPAEAAHGDLGRVSADDVVLALSHSGESEELTRILIPMKEIGATLIGITSRSRSTLARACDCVIVYGDVPEACPVGLAPSTSCIVMMGIGDALAFTLMRMRDFGPDDFARFHPAGSLGRRLRTVEEVMRTSSQLRIAQSTLALREVFVQASLPGRRTGAVLLVDENGRLEGLFTDSDLARLVENRDFTAFDRPISEYMTREPLTLRRGQRVWEALIVMRDHHVSEVPVLDSDQRPVGILDITDLVDLVPEAA